MCGHSTMGAQSGNWLCVEDKMPAWMQGLYSVGLEPGMLAQMMQWPGREESSSKSGFHRLCPWLPYRENFCSKCFSISVVEIAVMEVSPISFTA